MATWAIPTISTAAARTFVQRAAPLPETAGIAWTPVEPTTRSVVSLAGVGIEKEWDLRRHEVDRLRSFAHDWDGFGGTPAPTSMVERAQVYLEVLKHRFPDNPPMRTSLSPNGIVAFEWVQGNAFIQAEILDSARVEWMLAVPGQPTKFEIESFISAGVADPTKQEQVWQPKPSLADEPALLATR